MNKYMAGGLVAMFAAGGIGYMTFAATLSDKEDIDAIVETLTDEQMAPIEKPVHVPTHIEIDKVLVINVLNDLKEIQKHNGYTGIARKWKISRARVKQIEKSVIEEKPDRLPVEIGEIEK